MLRAYGMTDKGRVRSTNEDYFVIDEDMRLCVVADGMGGHNAGEIAARLAVDAIVDFVRESRNRGVETSADTWPFGYDRALSAASNLLKTAIHIANLQVLRVAGTTEEYSGMGTTVVAALMVGDQLSVGHVGDSRLYLVAQDRMRLLTHDDSWMATVLTENPDTDPAALQHHPMRNALTNVVGARPQVDVHLVEETLTGGERLLLSTDGVHGVLDDLKMERFVVANTDLAQVPEGLVGAALEGGSRDNCTVVVAQYAPD